MRNKIYWISLGLGAGCLIVAAGRLFTNQALIKNAQTLIEFLRTNEAWSAVLFLLLYIGFSSLFFPVAILTAAAGILFGFSKGFVLALLGFNLAAHLHFFTGRSLLQKPLRNLSRKNRKLSAVGRAVQQGGWKIVALSRLSLIFPFCLLNYYLGATRIRFSDYAAGTGLAMLPGCAILVYLGFSASNLIQYIQSRQTYSFTNIALGVTGIVMTVAIVLYTALLAKEQLHREKVC